MLMSVITPTKNSGKYLKHCIASVMGQTREVEHIVVDGGSSDDTLTLLAGYDHIKWSSEPDEGMYHAINKGLSIAKGEIVGYLNADDRYAINTSSTVLEVFENYPDIDFVYGGCTYIDENGSALYTYRALPYMPKVLISMKEICWAQPSCFWRRRVHERIGSFDATLRYCGDYDFFLRLISKNFKGFRIRQVLCSFMIHRNSLSVTAHMAMAEEYTMIQQKYPVQGNCLLGICGSFYFKCINLPGVARRLVLRA
jgi:glycosyltransferase involved in cell wall biosynthesis